MSIGHFAEVFRTLVKTIEMGMGVKILQSNNRIPQSVHTHIVYALKSSISYLLT